MVAKFADHLPLYRPEKIFARAGLAIARSTLAQWVGQTGVQLQPLVDALLKRRIGQVRKKRVVSAERKQVLSLNSVAHIGLAYRQTERAAIRIDARRAKSFTHGSFGFSSLFARPSQKIAGN